MNPKLGEGVSEDVFDTLVPFYPEQFIIRQDILDKIRNSFSWLYEELDFFWGTDTFEESAEEVLSALNAKLFNKHQVFYTKEDQLKYTQNLCTEFGRKNVFDFCFLAEDEINVFFIIGTKEEIYNKIDKLDKIFKLIK